MPSVLIVEDNPDNRDMLARRLARHGWDIHLAITGTEALSTTRDRMPDIVLMDMSLPEIDGWEATRRLKANPATRAIPIVALTAHALPEDRERALDAGCDDFDTKPVQLARLLDKMDRCLGAGKQDHND